MSAAAGRRAASAVLFALALATCSCRRGTGARSDAAPAPDEAMHADVQGTNDASGQPSDRPPGDPVLDPRRDPEPSIGRDVAVESRFECTPRLTSIRPPLDAQPGILWKTTLVPPRAPPTWDGIAVTRDRVSVASADMAYILDRKGNQKSVYLTDGFYFLGGVVADPQGNFYYTERQAFSLTGDGTERWKVALRADSNPRSGRPSPFLLSPEGVLYSALVDGWVRAFEKDTGGRIWATDLTDQPARAHMRTLAGYRDWLVVRGRDGNFYVFDRRDGSVRATIVQPTEWDNALGVSSDFGIFIGTGLSDRHISTSRRLAVHGFDGVLRWAVSGHWESRPVFVDLQGRLVVSEYAAKPPGTPQLVRYSCDGQRLEVVPFPPGAAGRPIAITEVILGADGVAYAVTVIDVPLPSGVPYTQEVVALSPDLRAVWRTTIETTQITRGAVLSDDGVLHVLFQHPDATQGQQIIAIQTTSPGPAKTSWPATRGDNFSSGWLADLGGP